MMSRRFSEIATALALIGFLSLAPCPAIAEAPADPQHERLRTLTDEVIADVEDLRGWAFKRPVERAIQTRSHLLARLEEDFDEYLPPDDLRRHEAVLKLSGLVGPEVDVRQTWLDLLAIGIAGFYDPDEQTFYILEDVGQRYGPLPLATLIAHELTHALDDQHIGLDPLMENVEGDSDRQFAIAAMVEGSASVLMNRYMVRKLDERGLGALGLAAAAVIPLLQEDPEVIWALEQAPRYFQTFAATYTLGEVFFNWTNMQDGQYVNRSIGDVVLQAAADPPRSSQQIIHPEKYWDPARRVDPVEIVDEDIHELVATLPDEPQVAHAETLGELLITLLTEPEHAFWHDSGRDAWTNAVAERWSGDRFFVVESEGDRRLRGLWITVWEDEAARDTFAATYRKSRPQPMRPRQGWPLGDVAAVHTFGFDRETARQLRDQLTASPPRFTRAGEGWPLPGLEP